MKSRFKEIGDYLNSCLKSASENYTANMLGCYSLSESCIPNRFESPPLLEFLLRYLKDDVGGSEEHLMMEESLFYWGLSKGVYVFDPELQSALTEETSIKHVPIESFKSAPERCLAIAFNEPTEDGADCAIVRVHNKMDASGISVHPIGLTVCYMKKQTFKNFPIFCVDGKIDDGFALLELKMEEVHGVDKGREICRKLANQWDTAMRFLNCALYLCSKNRDLVFASSGNNVDADFQYRRNKKATLKSKPINFAVGTRVGPRLKLSSARSISEGSSSISVRPHLRRAHWHHYWVGPKESRDLVLKWIAPTLVGTNTSRDIDTTIRRVG